MAYGYELAADRRTLQPNPTEQEALTILRDCWRAGFSMQAIAEELNRRGGATRAGSAWRFAIVRESNPRPAD